MSKTEENKVKPVDTNDQVMMIKEGLHPNYADKRHPDVWTKTAKEKETLKQLKHYFGKGMSGNWSSPRKSIPVPGKLIVYMRKGGTKSFKCMQHNIPDILNSSSMIGDPRDLRSNVLKYKWNGKTYNTNELPFWQPKAKNTVSLFLRDKSI